MSSGPDLAWRTFAVVAACADGVGVVLYLAIIGAQGDDDGSATAWWAAAMALPGLLCLLAVVLPPRTARWLLAAALVPAGGIGLLAILTIGLLFLLVAALATVAAALCLARSQARPARRRAAPSAPVAP